MRTRFSRAALALAALFALSLPAFASHNGTLVGSPTFSTGKFSNAIGGLGDSNYVSLPSGTFSYGTSAFTIEAWLKTTVSGSTQVAVFAGSTSTEVPVDWMGLLSNGHFGASVSGNSALSSDGTTYDGATLDSGITINDGNWHHCAVVYGSGTLKVYVDGVAGSTTLTGTPTALTATSGYIGRFTATGFSWGGSIDEVAVFNYAKYTANFTPPSSPYVGDETSLLDLYHLDGNANDSTGTFNPGSASLPQSDNFDSDTTGAIAPGWYDVSGNWQVGTVGPVSGNSFGDTEDVDGDAALYSNMATVADMQVYDEQVLAGDGRFIGVLLRVDSGYGNGYLVTYQFTNSTTLSLTIWKRVSGAYTSINSTNVTLTETIGATYAIRAQVQGSTISAKVWLKTSGEPGSWNATQTDTSITAAGYAGLYNSGTYAKSIDNLTISAPSAYSTIAPNNAAFLYSPGNWSVNSSQALSINAGAYFSILFTGSTVQLNFNVSNLGSPASEIYYRIDGYSAGTPFTEANVAATIIPTMPTATSALPYHLLEVVIKSTSETMNRWNSPSATAVIFTGLSIASGASVLAPNPAPGGTVLFFGDSITEGVRTVNYTATNDTDRNDAMMSWAYAQRQLLGVEVGVIGFGASGLTVTGSGNVPVLSSSYNYIMSGVARTPPSNTKMIVLNEGTNDSSASGSSVTSALTTVLNDLLSAYPNVPIVVMRPFNGSQASALQAGIAACSNPSLVHWMDTTGFFNTAYGADNLDLHPSGPNNLGIIAPLVAGQLSPILYPKGRSYSFF
ncbi:MAG TPA: LamG-like jellyroll fold domain-containing protein [Candidatus Aquilonibacter sp.]|nr:LamG-like jellyroll fold domain-containing protein [Candidatus Aquilonibacter sp.]